MVCLVKLSQAGQPTYKNDMQLFFNKTLSDSRVLPRNQLWLYAKAGLKRNLNTVTSYYHSRGFATKGNHFLIRLLDSINVDHDIDIERFYDIVSAKTNKLSISFGMTSSVYSGKFFDGIFYGPEVKEILIADDTYISPYEIQKNWKHIQSITVLDHPKSDLDLLLPNGKTTSAESGTATILINVPALATQFREFAKEQQARIGEGVNPISMAMFIHKYVLPNMLYSHLDVALFNRMNNMAIGKPMGETTVKHPIVVLDYTKHVDEVYRDLLKRIQSTEVDFWAILRSIPMCTDNNALELMRLPDMASTRQLAWAEFVTRLKCVQFLVSTAVMHGRKINNTELNYFLKTVTMYTSGGVFAQIANPDIYHDTVRTVKDILQLTTVATTPVH